MVLVTSFASSSKVVPDGSNMIPRTSVNMANVRGLKNSLGGHVAKFCCVNGLSVFTKARGQKLALRCDRDERSV